jgi:hypothetical protein
MSLLNRKRDKYGQEIRPGDVCVYNGAFVVYKKPSWGGPISKGLYGQFVTESGSSSIKFTSVLFAFDPLSDRRSKAPLVKAVTKGFYE